MATLLRSVGSDADGSPAEKFSEVNCWLVAKKDGSNDCTNCQLWANAESRFSWTHLIASLPSPS
jgi:hypothetical protein